VSVRLKEAADLVTRCVEAESRPFVALEHIESGSGRLVPQVELPEREAPDTGAAAVQAGDVLFGKLRPYLAKTWLADRPVFASTELLCLRPRPGVDGRWLAYLVATRRLVEWAVASSDGTKMPRTSWEKLAEYRIDIPSIATQRAIADYLDRETARIDALIEKKQRMIELAEMRFWTALVDAVLQCDAPLTPIRRVLTFLTDGPFGSAFTSQDYSGDGAAVVRLGNIGFAEYRPAEQAFIPLRMYRSFLRHQVMPGDLLIAGLGDPSNHPGRACVAPDLGPAMVKGKCFCARVDARRASSEYLALLLSSPYGAQLLGVSGHGSTRTMINLEIIKETPLPLPGASDQERIVQTANRHRRHTRSLVVALTEQISRLGEHRQALITAAITGELDVPGVAA
jgi:type I restriction enzyme S subunit